MIVIIQFTKSSTHRIVCQGYKDKRMPRYPTKKRNMRSKPYGTRSTRRSTGVTSIARTLGPRNHLYGFPRSLKTKLRYVENLAFNSASGATDSNVYRANSLFDPNETGVGHQPMTFDQYAAVYGRYTVTKSVMKVTFNANTELAGTSVFQIGIVGQKTGSISANNFTNCEQSHAVWGQLNGRNGNAGQKTLQLEYTPESCLYSSNKESDVGALTSTNPNNTYKYVIWCSDINGVGTTVLYANVEIIYDVVFSDNIFITSS